MKAWFLSGGGGWGGVWGQEGINNGMGLKNALHVPQQIVKSYLLFVNDFKDNYYNI
jgi:hypothetical protein